MVSSAMAPLVAVCDIVTAAALRPAGAFGRLILHFWLDHIRALTRVRVRARSTTARSGSQKI